MGWTKGKPRKPKPSTTVEQPAKNVHNAGLPPKRVAAPTGWEEAIEERERVLRADRDEPASRREGALRADYGREDPMDDLEDTLDVAALESILPSPPKVPGWHHFWGSTTNQQTPIQMYIRLGYVFVHPDEIPEWKYMKAHSAQFSCEVLQVNEMILMKTTEERYQRIMKHVHHDKPMSEAERLLVNVELLKQEVGQDSKGNSLVREEGDGLAGILGDRRLRSGQFE